MSFKPMIILLAIIFSIIPAALSIDCYQCDSNIDLECSEQFDSDGTQLKPRPCANVYEARFCIKTTGMYSGRIGTIRNCSSRDLGDYCNYIRRPGDSVLIRSCVFTCSRDGCNSAPALAFSTLLTIPLVVVVWLGFY